MLSVHDALEAWQAGEITSRRAMLLTGAADLMELYGMAIECDVEIRLTLTPEEEAAVTAATDAIGRAFARSVALSSNIA